MYITYVYLKYKNYLKRLWIGIQKGFLLSMWYYEFAGNLFICILYLNEYLNVLFFKIIIIIIRLFEINLKINSFISKSINIFISIFINQCIFIGIRIVYNLYHLYTYILSAILFGLYFTITLTAGEESLDVAVPAICVYVCGTFSWQYQLLHNGQ